MVEQHPFLLSYSVLLPRTSPHQPVGARMLVMKGFATMEALAAYVREQKITPSDSPEVISTNPRYREPFKL